MQAHSGLSEEQKKKVWCLLNYEKLSSECCNHLAQNSKFPSKSALEALVSQQCKLKNLLNDTNELKSFVIDSPCSSLGAESKSKKSEEQIVLYAGRVDVLSENENLRTNLQGMQWRVLELEKVCKKMQDQMTKMMRSRLSGQSNARSLPRLCS